MKRLIRIEGDAAYVTLTQGYTAVIDAADAALVQKGNWCALVERRPDGSIRNVYATRVEPDADGVPRTILMHRLILGAQKGEEVDHEDCDGLNNRRNNIRVATKAENMHNRRISIANSSGVKGVSLSRNRRKWVARIRLNRTEHYLGTFNRLEDAAAAYAAASVKLHGDFGRTA